MGGPKRDSGEAASAKVRVAKTKKGKRYLEAKAPKLVENPKKLMTLRGRKASGIIQRALADLGEPPARPHVVELWRYQGH